MVNSPCWSAPSQAPSQPFPGTELVGQSPRDRLGLAGRRSGGARTSRWAPGGSLLTKRPPGSPAAPPARAGPWPLAEFNSYQPLHLCGELGQERERRPYLGTEAAASFRLCHNSDRVAAGGWGQRIPIGMGNFSPTRPSCCSSCKTAPYWGSGPESYAFCFTPRTFFLFFFFC